MLLSPVGAGLVVGFTEQPAVKSSAAISSIPICWNFPEFLFVSVIFAIFFILIFIIAHSFALFSDS